MSKQQETVSVWDTIAKQAETLAAQHAEGIAKYRSVSGKTKELRDAKVSEFKADLAFGLVAMEGIAKVEGIAKDMPEDGSFVLFALELAHYSKTVSEIGEAIIDGMLEETRKANGGNKETMKEGLVKLANLFEATVKVLAANDYDTSTMPTLEKLSKGGRPAGSKNSRTIDKVRQYSFNGSVHTSSVLSVFLQSKAGSTVPDFATLSGITVDVLREGGWTYTDSDNNTYTGETVTLNNTDDSESEGDTE